MRGDYAGASEDFQVYLEWKQSVEPQDRLDRRQEWIEQLQAGENPFDQATLEELLGE